LPPPAQPHVTRTTTTHRPHTPRTRRAATVRSQRFPLPGRPAKTPFGGLPPPFPTTLPPQGDPERGVWNGPRQTTWPRQAGQRERRLRAGGAAATGDPRPQSRRGSPEVSPRPFLPLLPQARGPAARAGHLVAQAGEQPERNPPWRRPKP